MNVKLLIIFAPVLCSLATFAQEDESGSSIHVEMAFGNPYKDEMSTIHTELVQVYDVVRECINNFLMDVPLATGTEIESSCVGPHYNIINHIFLLKMKKAMELYNKSLTERFEQAFGIYPDEIAYFMSLYKMFLDKGFHNIYDTMQLAKRGSGFYVQEDVYDSLLALSKDMLQIIGKFSALLVDEKTKIKKFIKEQIEQRDENLKILLRQDKGGISEQEAHEKVVSESHNKNLTLAQRIHNMDLVVKNETESIQSGSAMDEEDIERKDLAGPSKYNGFEDNIMPLKEDNKAELALMTEFTPEAIKDEPNEEDEIFINENAPVPKASEPVFKDELDFFYERKNNL